MLVETWQDDNVLGIESLFDIELTEQQKELVRLADDQKARVAVSSCTGSGKTAVLSMLTLLYLMILPDCRILITSPSSQQLRRVFYAEVKKWVRRMPEQFQEYYDLTIETIKSIINNLNFEFITEREDGKLIPVKDKYGFNIAAMDGHQFLYTEHAIGLSQRLIEALRGFPRQALHARALGLIHPASGEALSFECPLPADLQQLLAVLAEEDPLQASDDPAY